MSADTEVNGTHPGAALTNTNIYVTAKESDCYFHSLEGERSTHNI